MRASPFLAVTMVACALGAAPAANLVSNGSFEAGGDGKIEHWRAAGSDVDQELAPDAGRDGAGGRSARLTCTRMGKDSPAAHAMICQVGRVGVRRGQWYRLSFWARAEGLRDGAVNVAMPDTRAWRSSGLDDAFVPGSTWGRHEMTFRAAADVPAEASRLQFWFKSTGTLWLDDVELTETEDARRWLPQWTTEGATNLVPNASFECGPANWGSYSAEGGGWGNHLFRLHGQIDEGGGFHGRRCLKIELGPRASPVFWFDYFEATRKPVRRALAANLGWLKVTPGETLTLSAYVRADREGAVARLAAIAAEGGVQARDVRVGKAWQRVSFSFRAARSAIFVGVGPDLDAAALDAVTMWVDAVQLERGDSPTPFAPRQAVESFLVRDVGGNVFTDRKAGVRGTVMAHNDADRPATVRGAVAFRVNDEADQDDARARRLPVALEVPAKGSAAAPFALAGPLGFYRVAWEAPAEVSSTTPVTLRCALIEPFAPAPGESPVGMNHAYPWDFLVREAHLAGINQWRDWSAKWHVVEPRKGEFDFRAADEQIERVIDLGGRALVLLPFPSSLWASRYDAAADRNPPRAGYERQRRPIAHAPRDLDDFGRYAEAVARRYKGRAAAFHILNEPIYTDYALPRAYGYKLEDYLAILEKGYRAIKSVDGDAIVVGGIGTGPDAGLSREFVEKGGLRFVDAMDIHVYRPPVPAEVQAKGYAELEALMRKHGGAKPIWVTEYGCYADDDPACVPESVGDAAMNRSRWPSEQAAAEHLTKFVAATAAHGVRKLYLHAGNGGQINHPDAGGVFFEYGGAPRRMYPAVAALTRILGTPDATLAVIDREDGLHARVFRRGASSVAVAWAEAGRTVRLTLAEGARAYDLMGNELAGREVTVKASPVYLVEEKPDADAIRRVLRQ